MSVVGIPICTITNLLRTSNLNIVYYSLGLLFLVLSHWKWGKVYLLSGETLHV